MIFQGLYLPDPEQDQFVAHVRAFGMVTDSLKSTPPAEHARLRRRLAEELEAMRALLVLPEQLEAFDPIARIWLREQARQGHSMTVPGVAPRP